MKIMLSYTLGKGTPKQCSGGTEITCRILGQAIRAIPSKNKKVECCLEPAGPRTTQMQCSGKSCDAQGPGHGSARDQIWTGYPLKSLAPEYNFLYEY